MADWTLIPCLAQLRREFNAIAPLRDRSSDGSVGDAAHAGTGTSDHLPDEDFPRLRDKDSDRLNEVHAIDVDVNLAVPGLSMEDVVQHILARCRAGTEKRLRYIIYNRRIWEASNGWRQEAYGGGNPHDKHAHFSASYRPELEASTAPFGLADLLKKEEPMTTSAQNWAHDVDPGAGTYSAGGALWTILGRSGLLNNLSAQSQDIVAALEDQGVDLDAQGASLALIISMLNQLLADPADVGPTHPLVAAIAYYFEEVAPDSPAAQG